MRVRVWPCLLAAVLVGCFERGSASSRAGEAPLASDDAAVAQSLAPAPVPAPEPAGTPASDAVIHVRIEAEPAHLNPVLAGEAVALRIVAGDIYQGLLCRARPGGVPEPCLAESVEIDGRVVRARLRAGVRWHDGAPLTAADVIYSYRLPTAVASWLAPSLDDLERVTAVGEREVELTFTSVRPGRRDLLADVPILPAHVFPAAGPELATAAANRRPVGTGPLRLARWDSGDRIELVRFAGYWGPPARAARIVYHVVPSRARALAMLSAGELDLVPQLPVDVARDAAGGELISYGYENPAYLAAVYNLRRAPLDRAVTRRALTQLLDRDSVVRVLLDGHGRVISGPFLPGSPAADPDIRPWPFDRRAARGLLQTAPRVTVLVPAGSRTMARVGDIWAADARGVVDLLVEEVPYAELLGRVREGRFQVALLAFTSGRDPDFYGRFHSSQIGRENYGGLADPELDGLLEQARAEADDDLRAVIGRQIHRRLHQLQPYTFIATDARAGLARRGIGGLADGAGLAGRLLWRAR